MTATTTPNVFPYVDGHSHKPPMEREELRDAINLSLWAGQMLLQNGADSARVEELIHRTGTGLGCDWMDIVILPASITATTMSNQEFRTRVRRAPARGVNMTIIAEITELSYQVREGRLDRFGLRTELRRIDTLPPHYNRWMVVLGVGLACASFSRLFGGDALIFGVTFMAASAAMFVRQELHHRYFNPLIITVLTALVAGICASLVTVLNPAANADTTFSAAALLLVPGVPLINSTEDLIRGHLVTGIARGVMGLLVSLSIALGLALAIWITGSGAL